jgi:phage major head subunit gpT-like protein
MPANAINVGPLLTPGVQGAFQMTFQRETEALVRRMDPMMQLGVPSSGRYEIYAAAKSAPHASRWRPGNKASYKGFGSFQWTTENLDWEVGSYIDEDDAEDDRLGLAVSRAQDSASALAELPFRVFSQIISSATNPDLLPTIPTAPDGQALFATSSTFWSNGYRYGISTGNILTGSGVGSAAVVLDDFFSGVQRFGEFLDTELLPLHNLDRLNAAGFDVMFPVTHVKLFTDAFKAAQQVIVVQNVAGTENVAATPIDNTIRTGGINVTLHANPLISGNDWYIFARGARVKPVYEQMRSAASYSQFDRTNSRQNMEERLISWHWKGRSGFGCNMPEGALMVNN